MQASLSKRFTLAAAASAAMLLAACGGGGGDSGSSGTPSATISGKAVDFYLSGATVSFLDCKDSAGKALTVVTGANGDFTFPANCTKSALSVSGGTDIGTGLPFNGVMQAPAVDYRAGVTPMISPLTTLVAQLGADQAAALATKLGLSGKDLLNADPLTDADVLKAAVVVQQLVEQISKTLQGVATGAGGSLSADAAAAAAAKAVASVVSSGSGTADLSSASTVSAAIKASVKNAQSSLPSTLQSSIDTVATNVAALAAPLVSKQIGDVNTALGTIKLGGNAASTVAALKGNGALNALKDSSQSTLSTTLASSTSASVLTDGNNASKLADLGNAVATGSADDVQSKAGAIQGLDSGKLNTIVSKVTLNDYLQASNVTINGLSTTLGDQMSATGNLSDVKAVLKEIGAPFGTGAADIRVGLHYSYKGNTVDVIFEKVSLVFSGGNLVSATFPANTNFSFRVTGSLPASATLSNVSADNLFSSGNGQFTLPFAAILNKVKNSGALTDAQFAALAPKAPGSVDVAFAVAGVDGSDVKLGIGTGTAAKYTSKVSVQTAGGQVSGYGLKSTITLN
ncbi:hypothetical protein LMG31506_02179 [Cupriavidus yeoncheonensis]|uniref:Membrane associated, exported and processed into extracellular protein EXP n=1 Tax=Cupriavidus yeoncheonensis TaxID=1462994 RepID=A0A916IU65_9BURK|nr:hypothetical protein [Cupriavidus yeoncheonensis]CAG2140139.1 hypothetical protein LMG31506_02179 [Cupriavidus yeoncheonensis]